MILTLIVVILGLVAGAVYAVWLSYLEDQADRQAFDRLMSASSESKGWPCPRGPKGFAGDCRHVGRRDS